MHTNNALRLVFGHTGDRASTGYGKRWLHLGDGQWGATMQQDLTDAVAWAVKDGFADPARVAIMGGRSAEALSLSVSLSLALSYERRQGERGGKERGQPAPTFQNVALSLPPALCLRGLGISECFLLLSLVLLAAHYPLYLRLSTVSFSSFLCLSLLCLYAPVLYVLLWLWMSLSLRECVDNK